MFKHTLNYFTISNYVSDSSLSSDNSEDTIHRKKSVLLLGLEPARSHAVRALTNVATSPSTTMSAIFTSRATEFQIRISFRKEVQTQTDKPFIMIRLGLL